MKKKVPIWKLVDELAFGELRNIIDCASLGNLISSKFRIDSKKIVFSLWAMNSWRNILAHRNEIKSKIHKKFKLIEILNILHKTFANFKTEFKNIFSNYDYIKIGIEKIELWGNWEITGFFK